MAGKRGRGGDKKKRKSRKTYPSAGDDTTDISSFLQRTNNNDEADANSDDTNNNDDSDTDNDSSSSENSSDNEDDSDMEDTNADDNHMDMNYEDQHYEEEEDDDDANAVAYPDEAEETIVDRVDVVANLDIDEDEDTLEVNGEFNIGDGLNSPPRVAPTGIQQKYLWSLHNRLRVECNERSTIAVDKWLLRHLKKNDWCISRQQAPSIAKLLKIEVHHAAYYRKVVVWIPDMRWGNECTPACPSCLSNRNVRSFGFNSNHYGRKIVGLTENYYAISKRYVCRACEKKNKESADEKIQYTHMGWNQASLTHMPYGYGDEFPAFLTHKSGLDKLIIKMMRPMMDKGYRANATSDLLLELHTDTYTQYQKRYEFDVMKAKRNPLTVHETHVDVNEMFSSFEDKERYSGQVPTAGYLLSVRKKHHESISSHLDRDVKKRDADRAAWDVSYKEAGCLMNYKGEPLYKGLVTMLNGIGEVRGQFHVVTDAQDQFDGALTAFKNTLNEYGLSPPTLFSTDNPFSDRRYFPKMLPSLQASQEKFNAMVNASNGNGDDDDMEVDQDAPIGLIPYPFQRDVVTIASTDTEMNEAIDALRENIGPAKVVGFDTETKVELNERRMPTGIRSRTGLFQLAYRDKSNNLRVLFLRMCKLGAIPHRVIQFFREDSITLVGVNIGGDLSYIRKDYPEMDQVIKSRQESSNVSLGTYARKRDVVQTGTVGLSVLVDRLLGYRLPKDDEDRFADWNITTLTEQMIKYAALDAIGHLQCYEKLQTLPDLTLRLKKDDIRVGDKVDFVPRSGQRGGVSTLATRAATGYIVDLNECESGEGILPKRYKVGKTTTVIELEKIHSPSFKVPKYTVEATGEQATLKDIGPDKCVVVPLSMIRKHQESRPTPQDVSQGMHTRPRITLPANASTADSVTIMPLPPTMEMNDDEDIDMEELDFHGGGNILDDLTTADIESLRAANVHSVQAQSDGGWKKLNNPKLPECPAPNEIEEVYSSVLGDPFHGIDRIKVPTDHEGKKAFKVAYSNAMFEFNPTKLEELENHMRESGMTNVEIDCARYYNSRLYLNCVDRSIPSPRLLYYRVRAVFCLYGSMKDSKSNRPLFNDKAWEKACNILKEIRMGLYSDPPGVEMYYKKLKPSGEVKKNKYGMDIIECMRGTNKVETYHKNLMVTFGNWHTGPEMTTVLLAERRLRHNQKTSERRRKDFPKVGHFNPWDVDLIQNLVRENHGVILYPGWTNASDYKDTDESFDTVALHSAELHDALKEQCSKIKGKFKLTREQKFLCKATGTDLPFLPFTTEEEKSLFSQYIATHEKKSDEEIALWWIQKVNGVDIFPKLPVHIRVWRKKWQKKNRVKDFVSRAKTGAEKLKELNRILAPSPQALPPIVETQQTATTSVATDSIPAIAAPPMMPTQSQVQTWPTINVPPPLQQPLPQALHNAPYSIVGGIIIGESPMVGMPDPSNTRGKDKVPGGRIRRCGRCKNSESDGGKANAHTCPGKGARKLCYYFDDSSPIPKRRCGRCHKYGGEHAYECRVTKGKITEGHINTCEYYDNDGKQIG